MKNEKEPLRCDECGEVLKTGIPDQDSRGYIWCRNCGLVYDPGHEMGIGLMGLLNYVNHKSLIDYIDSIMLTYQMEGLAKARLMVAKL